MSRAGIMQNGITCKAVAQSLRNRLELDNVAAPGTAFPGKHGTFAVHTVIQRATRALLVRGQEAAAPIVPFAAVFFTLLLRSRRRWWWRGWWWRRRWWWHDAPSRHLLPRRLQRPGDLLLDRSGAESPTQWSPVTTR